MFSRRYRFPPTCASPAIQFRFVFPLRRPVNLAAILVSSALVFGVNLRWTFRHRDVRLPHHSAAKFVGVQVGSLVLIALGFAVVTGLTSSVLVWNVAKFLLTIGVGFGRFYLYREWVYTDHGHRPAPQPAESDSPR